MTEKSERYAYYDRLRKDALEVLLNKNSESSLVDFFRGIGKDMLDLDLAYFTVPADVEVEVDVSGPFWRNNLGHPHRPHEVPGSKGITILRIYPEGRRIEVTTKLQIEDQITASALSVRKYEIKGVDAEARKLWLDPAFNTVSQIHPPKNYRELTLDQLESLYKSASSMHSAINNEHKAEKSLKLERDFGFAPSIPRNRPRRFNY